MERLTLPALIFLPTPSEYELYRSFIMPGRMPSCAAPAHSRTEEGLHQEQSRAKFGHHNTQCLRACGWLHVRKYLEHARSVPEAPGKGVHAADVAVEKVKNVSALPPQLGVKIDAACSAIPTLLDTPISFEVLLLYSSKDRPTCFPVELEHADKKA